MALAKMRSLPECYKLIKKEDPNTSISMHFLRMLVKQNKIPYFNAGVKILVNYDKLMDYLDADPVEDDEVPIQDYGHIRKVSE